MSDDRMSVVTGIIFFSGQELSPNGLAFIHMRNGTDCMRVNRITLVEKYGPYTIEYGKDTSVKRLKALRNNTASNTAVEIISYGEFTMQ